ncbi:MAG: IS21 family transposase [Sphaerochaeta sp.]|jgi:transposase|nr:IS21 family transposase [Sphaerochaeta sp.]
MLKMSQIENIKNMWREGSTIAEIREVTDLDRKTISKYIQQEDFSKDPEQYAKETRPSKLDPYKPIIDGLLEKQSEYFHKQRFTAKRMHEYLVEECGAKELEHSYILVRIYMKSWRNERRRNNGPGTLKLVWHPGEAQADFGQADFIDTDGSYVRKHYLVMSFPYSNTALYEILPGENGECVCQGLQDFFTYLGGVPYSILFDNATGIAKRYANIIQQSELFTRFRLHHNFIARFANIRSGWEKGNVENKVGALRRNLLVPPMQLSYPIQQFNKEVMIPKSFAFRADEQHYEKGATFKELFVQDRKALGPLPAKAFHVAKIESLGTNGTGSLTLESGHTYVLGSGRTNETVLVSKGAWEISVYTSNGVFIKTFPRAYGKEPSTVYDIEAMLSSSIHKPNAWMNSPVRDVMEDGGFKQYLDEIDNAGRRRGLYMLNECAERFGFGVASVAANRLCKDGKIPSRDDLVVLCNRMASFPLEASDNATNVNLGAYDALLNKSGGAAS